MQYILTEDEYENLTPILYLTKEKAKVELLNNKVMELSNHPCGNGKTARSVTFYCDSCPIGALGTGTCTKNQQYSK